MTILGNRITAVVAGAAVIATLGSTAAFAANTITGDDVRDGTLTPRDFNKNVQTYFGNLNERSYNSQKAVVSLKKRVTQLEGTVADLQAAVAELQDEDTSGIHTNWKPSDEGSTIVDANNVELRQFAADGETRIDGGDGTSVEIVNLNAPVQAMREVKFTYELKDGATWGAGSPRVFLEIGGNFHNTFDQNNPGTENADGSFTVTWEIPVNGVVGAAGVVSDNSSVGSVVVSDLVIDGHTVKFK